ncbi:MAG TPA: winged helix-turn-helix transcriptional regulator [Nitrososphaeraceae archaeon]
MKFEFEFHYATTTSSRYIKFRNTMKGFSSKTMAKRLKELDESGILERQTITKSLSGRIQINQ